MTSIYYVNIIYKYLDVKKIKVHAKSLVFSDNWSSESYINTNHTLHRRKYDRNPKVGQIRYVPLL